MPLSLKTRLSIGVVLAVLATTFTMTTAALYLVKTNLRAAIEQEQFNRLTAISDAVDQKFVSRRVLLDSFGRSMEFADFKDAASVRAFLARHSAMGQVFANLAVLDKDGDLVASLIEPPSRTRVNVRDRAYFLDTLASRAGLISQPIKNRMNGKPQVVMTEPVFDSQGAVRYVVAAPINLQEKNFLGELADVKFGQSGYLFIVNTAGIVIDHPRKERILNPESDGGGPNPAMARALAGFEGTAEAVNRYGVDGLYAFKRMQQTNWIVGAIYPANEAFASIETVSRKVLAGACLLALVAGALSLLVLRRNLVPLTQLGEHMRTVANAPHYVPSQQTFADDEIGELGRSFDALMRELQRTQTNLATSERRTRMIADSMPVLISHLDLNFRYTYANARYLEWFTLPVDNLVGHTVAEVFGEATFERVRPHMELAMQGTETSFELVNPIEGSPTYLSLHYLPDLDANGQVVGIYGMVRDRTEHHIARKRLEENVAALQLVERNLDELARRDGLTGLPNRRQFDERLEEVVQRSLRSQRPMALIFLDIDYFKSINDTLGHATGDAVLKAFAQRLAENIRTTDFAARLAGDEFVIIMESLNSAEDAVVLAKKLLAAIRAPVNISGELGGVTHVTSSLGVAYCADHRESAMDMLARADRALYRAKAAGRDGYELDVGVDLG